MANGRQQHDWQFRGLRVMGSVFPLFPAESRRWRHIERIGSTASARSGQCREMAGFQVRALDAAVDGVVALRAVHFCAGMNSPYVFWRVLSIFKNTPLRVLPFSGDCDF